MNDSILFSAIIIAATYSYTSMKNVALRRMPEKLVTSTKRSILIFIHHDGILSGASPSCIRKEAPIDAGISQFWEIELVVDLVADDPLEIHASLTSQSSFPLYLPKGKMKSMAAFLPNKKSSKM